MSADDSEAVPALFEHAYSVYTAMKERAHTEQLHEHEDGEGLVYEGFLTKLVTVELGLAIPYYTSIMRMLKEMQCVTQLRRGGSSAPSRWALHGEPTVDAFRTVEERLSARMQQEKTTPDSQRVTDLNRRVTVLEEQMEAVLQHFVTEETEV